MSKILLEITSPAAGESYDVFVPDNMQIGELISLLGTVFTQTSNGTYIFSNQAVLSEKNAGTVYSPNDRIRDLDIKNGTKLLFI